MVTTNCAGLPGNIFLHLQGIVLPGAMDNDRIETSLQSALFMTRRIFLCLLLLAGLSASLESAWAQARWRDLPPEERRQLRQQMRDHWQQERELRRDEGGPRHWGDLPPEDRRRMREEIREHRASQPHEREWRGGNEERDERMRRRE